MKMDFGTSLDDGNFLRDGSKVRSSSSDRYHPHILTH